MQLVLTTFGLAALGDPSPPILTSFKLGSSVAYTPSISDVDIHGTPENVGVPAAPVVINPNLLRYTIVVDTSAGPFDFGEVGLFVGANLFALGAFSVLQHKEPSSNLTVGGNLKIDCYVSVVGNSYAVMAETTNTTGNVNLPVLASLDLLPQPADTDYNTYVCITNVDQYVTSIATAEGGYWTLTGYEVVRNTGTVTSSAVGYINTGTNCGSLTYQGEAVLQFTSGALRGTVRNITGITLAGTRLIFSTPLNVQPDPGDTFLVFGRRTFPNWLVALLYSLNPALTASEINQLHGVSLAGLVNKDGSIPMTGALNMGSQRLTGLASPVASTDGTTKGYVDAQISSLNSSLQSASNDVASLVANAIVKNGSMPMAAPLNMAEHRLINLSDPLASLDGVNLRYLNTQLAALQALVVSAHNSLTGLQGGNNLGTQFYHVSQTERDFLASLVINGYPISSTTGAGLIEIADSAEIDAGTTNAHAISPSGFVSSLTEASVPTNMQNAIMAACRVPLLGTYQTATGPVAAPALNNNFSFDTLSINPENRWAVSPGSGTFTTFTVPVSGYYTVNLLMLHDTNAGSAFAITWSVHTSGSGDTVLAYAVVPNGLAGVANGSRFVAISANETVNLRPTFISGSPTGLMAGSYLTFQWVRPL